MYIHIQTHAYTYCIHIHASEFNFKMFWVLYEVHFLKLSFLYKEGGLAKRGFSSIILCNSLQHYSWWTIQRPCRGCTVSQRAWGAMLTFADKIGICTIKASISNKALSVVLCLFYHEELRNWLVLFSSLLCFFIKISVYNKHQYIFAPT